ncbi:catalase domain-containing protein [Pseudomonas putida S11]|nr:catalase domain-containing protein [Pseudomonas putida S11]
MTMNSPLHGPAKALRLAAIGVVMLGAGAAFAYAAGWVGDTRLTPQRIIDTFEAQAGHYPGYRKNHAKGLCVSGYFQPSGQAVSLSTARAFSQPRVPVIGRFAIGGANPFAPDTGIPVRSLAIELSTDDGQVWRTGMNNPPVLAVSTPQAFYEQVLAGAPDPATGKPDPGKLQAFFRRPPGKRGVSPMGGGVQAQQQLRQHAVPQHQRLPPDRRKRRVPPRALATGARRQRLPPCLPKSMTNSSCSTTCSNGLAQGPLRWTLRLVLAEPGDAVDDPASPWPADRRSVDAGTLVRGTGRRPRAKGPAATSTSTR